MPSARAWWIRHTRARWPCSRSITSIRHRGRARSSRCSNSRATQTCRRRTSTASSWRCSTTWLATSKLGSGTQLGCARSVSSRRASAGARCIRAAIRARSCATVGAPGPRRSTLQVWPASVSHSRSRIARSSGPSGSASRSDMGRPGCVPGMGDSLVVSRARLTAGARSTGSDVPAARRYPRDRPSAPPPVARRRSPGPGTRSRPASGR